jgi:chromosome segregation ATPase
MFIYKNVFINYIKGAVLTVDQNKIENLLVQILESQTSMKSDISNMKDNISNMQHDMSNMKNDISNMQGDMSNMKNDISNMQGDISNMKNDISNMQGDISNLTTKVDKNTLVLEKIQDDVKTLAEVHESYSEQIHRGKQIEEKALNERFDIIELATTDISKDVKFIKHKLHQTEEDVFDIKDHLRIIK